VISQIPNLSYSKTLHSGSLRKIQYFQWKDNDKFYYKYVIISKHFDMIIAEQADNIWAHYSRYIRYVKADVLFYMLLFLLIDQIHCLLYLSQEFFKNIM
jgi:hypothetical protein